jgi:hypothetical protein
MILPDSFIPAAERYGMMTTLDRWVVQNVFKIIADCLNDNHRTGPMATCAINLSGTSIGDDAFLEYLRQQFQIYAIPPELICFEITETSAIANLGSAIRFINELKSLGCRFSLDDFCAGHVVIRVLEAFACGFPEDRWQFRKRHARRPGQPGDGGSDQPYRARNGQTDDCRVRRKPPDRAGVIGNRCGLRSGYVIERPQLFTCECLHARPARQTPMLFSAPGTFR